MGRFTLVLGGLLIAVFAVNLVSAMAGGPALGASLQGETGDPGLSDWFSRLVTLVSEWLHPLDPVPATTDWKSDNQLVFSL